MIRIATIGTSAITRNLIDAIASTPGAVFAGTLSRDAARSRADSCSGRDSAGCSQESQQLWKSFDIVQHSKKCGSNPAS